MSTLKVLELFPDAGVEKDLDGLHLGHDLRSRAGSASPFVYSGFIASIDGRIGLEGTVGAPQSRSNDRDWRLFQELMVQADVVLVSGRYVRDVARGSAKSIIPSPAEAKHDDLVRYRLERGLSPRPVVAVITTTGDFDPTTAAGLSDTVIITHGAPVDAETARSGADAGLDSAHV
jgi:riboflavin biosynthesis pyrimidine reductase